MLNPFPQLLVFSFFAPTLLRVAAACVFFYLAYKIYEERDAIGKTHFPIVGVMGEWVAWLKVIVCALIGLALFFGWYTQIAALLGALGALKMLVYEKWYRSIIPLARTASVLLLIICLSLLLSGAGALARDLPL